MSKSLKKYDKLSNILKYIFIDICKINPKKYYILGFDKDKNNHQFLNLLYLLKWKKKMNREKDKADIILIKELLIDK